MSLSDLYNITNCKADPIIAEMNTTIMEAMLNQFNRIQGYLGVAVCLFGVTSNLANIVVLTRPSMRSPSNWILMWLAVADLLTMVSYIPMLFSNSIMKDPASPAMHTQYYFLNMYIFIPLVSFVVICHSAAIWLTVSLTVFRFVYIAQSTYTWQPANQRSASISVVFVYVFSLMLTVPNILSNKSINCSFPTDNVHDNLSSIVYYGIDSRNPTLSKINFWIQAIIVKIVPCILLSLMTIILIHQLNSVRSRRKSLLGTNAAREKRDRRTTLMLLTIVVLFILTELPQGILLLLIHVDSERFGRIYHKYGDVIDFVTICNQAINFVMYTLMSEDFRKTFSEVFIRPCCSSTLQTNQTAATLHTNQTAANGEENGVRFSTSDRKPSWRPEGTEHQYQALKMQETPYQSSV